MIRLRSRRHAPVPLVTPQIHTRIAILADGARYGGRVDDLHAGCIVIAAPDANLPPDRPVIVEWRDAAGLWRLPGEIASSREVPFRTCAIRPTGASECLSEGQVQLADGGLRVTARVVESRTVPAGTRVPVTTVQLAGDRIAFWTIVPVEYGDHVELSVRSGAAEPLRCGLVVADTHVQSGTWLRRVDCDAENPAAPSVAALVGHLLAASSFERAVA